MTVSDVESQYHLPSKERNGTEFSSLRTAVPQTRYPVKCQNVDGDWPK